MGISKKARRDGINAKGSHIYFDQTFVEFYPKNLMAEKKIDELASARTKGDSSNWQERRLAAEERLYHLREIPEGDYQKTVSMWMENFDPGLDGDYSHITQQDSNPFRLRRINPFDSDAVHEMFDLKAGRGYSPRVDRDKGNTPIGLRNFFTSNHVQSDIRLSRKGQKVYDVVAGNLSNEILSDDTRFADARLNLRERLVAFRSQSPELFRDPTVLREVAYLVEARANDAEVLIPSTGRESQFYSNRARRVIDTVTEFMPGLTHARNVLNTVGYKVKSPNDLYTSIQSIITPEAVLDAQASKLMLRDLEALLETAAENTPDVLEERSTHKLIAKHLRAVGAKVGQIYADDATLRGSRSAQVTSNMNGVVNTIEYFMPKLESVLNGNGAIAINLQVLGLPELRLVDYHNSRVNARQRTPVTGQTQISTAVSPPLTTTEIYAR